MDWAQQCAAIRKRPGMYVGDTGDGSGQVHMVLEVLGNAFDQYLLGRCRRIDVRLEADGSVVVEDDGPGFALGELTSLESVLTKFHTTPTADGHRPHVHLGPSCAGLAAVNALSERLEATSIRDGVMSTVQFARGEVVEAMVSHPTDRPSGTRIRFRPDREVFRGARLPRTALSRRLEELTFLSPGLVLSWSLAGEVEAAADLRGLVALDARLVRGGVAHHRGTYVAAGAPIQVEVAVAWSEYPDNPRVIHSFVNYRRTTAGIHVAGLLSGICAKFLEVPPHRVHDRLVAAVSVVLADVHFGNPTKDRLITPAVRKPVVDATRTALSAWCEAYPDAVTAVRGRPYVEGEMIVVEGLAGIRTRPEMYLGSIEEDGRLALVEQAMCLALQHHKAGGCTRIEVDIGPDDTITITDNGGALEPQPRTTGGHFSLRGWGLWTAQHSYLDECDLDIMLVAALSRTFEITVVQDGHRAQMRWREGLQVGDVEHGDAGNLPDGTTIRFALDADIFGTREVPRDALAARIYELTAFYPGLRLFLALR